MEKCCFMIDKNNQCSEIGNFLVQENNRRDPDNYSYSCEKHIGDMLGTTIGYPTCNSWTITFIENKMEKETCFICKETIKESEKVEHITENGIKTLCYECAEKTEAE